MDAPDVCNAMGAFDAFFAEQYPGVVRSLTLALSDRDLAEEAAQDGFARALELWADVSSMDRPTAWVYVVAMNRAKDRFRRGGRGAGRSDAVSPDPAGAVATAVSVRVALAALAPRQREAVVLRFLADLTVAEIAAVMGCAPGTVKSTLHHALNALRVDLEDGEEL